MVKYLSVCLCLCVKCVSVGVILFLVYIHCVFCVEGFELNKFVICGGFFFLLLVY